MKRFKYITSIAFASLALSLTGCDDGFMETSPTNQTSDATVTASIENLYLAVNGIHRKYVSQDGSSQGQGGEPGFGMCLDTQGDDMEFDSSVNGWHRVLQRWTAQSDPSSSYLNVPWMVYYMRILNANLILNSVDDFAEAGGNLYKQVKAEALTFRAHNHFMLVQRFAKRYVKGTANSDLGIPYRLVPTTDAMARNTVAEVYENLNKDIDEAIALMDGTPLKVDNINHFNYASMCGLKARIALAMQEYAVAADYADKAIAFAEGKKGAKLFSTSQISACPESAIFANITSNGEAVWAAMTQDDQTIYFYSYYANMSWNFNASIIRQAIKCINSKLYDTMSDTDLRRCWWDPTGTASVPKTSYTKRKYQNRKFTARNEGDAVGDYAFMRLSELYLMKAEGLARSGNDAAAQDVFTKFQETRDPDYKSQGNTGDALIAEIMNSRAVELWGEGFDWLDHKRLGLPIDRNGSNFDVAKCIVMDVPADDKRWQWAIPRQEMDSNELMVQNPL